MKSKHQYTYSFNEKVTSDMCGKVISYEATGYTGTRKEIVSKVLVKKCRFRILLLCVVVFDRKNIIRHKRYVTVIDFYTIYIF